MLTTLRINKRPFLPIIVFAGVLISGCGIDLPDPPERRDQVVLEYDKSTLTKCWLRGKGDTIPRLSLMQSSIKRAYFEVYEGKWDETLSRTGLTKKQCVTLGRQTNP